MLNLHVMKALQNKINQHLDQHDRGKIYLAFMPFLLNFSYSIY